jgi:hypothetical protein
MCLRMLLEGNSIRSTSRLTGTDKSAIIDLIVLVGSRAQANYNPIEKNGKRP